MKRTKNSESHNNAPSRQSKDITARDDEDEASDGTDDSYMNELKQKNDGTYDWDHEPVARSRSETDSEEGSLDDLKEQVRQCREAKRKRSLPKKIEVNALFVTGASKKKEPRPAVQAPHFPFASRQLNAIKPAKRKPEDAANSKASAPRTDDRRSKPMSLSHQNNIKKMRRIEPPPDTSALALFRPDAVLTHNAKNMKSGVGYDRAVGDIDTAIQISQPKEPARAPVERKSPTTEKVPTPPTRGRSSVSEAIARATAANVDPGPPTRIRNRSKSPRSRSPVKGKLQVTNPPPPTAPAHALDPSDADISAIADAWLKRGKTIRHPLTTSQPKRYVQPSQFSQPFQPPQDKLAQSPKRSKWDAEPPAPNVSVPNVSHPRASLASPTRLNASNGHTGLDDAPIYDSFDAIGTDVLPTVSDGGGRTWSGELTYNNKVLSLGTIRLIIPDESIRVENLPKLVRPTIHLKKMLSAQYLSTKWFSATAHPSKKPEALLVDFQDIIAQKRLVDVFRSTDSAGLAFDESCTLLFFFKQNERLRSLFNGVLSSSSPINVVVLPPIDVLDLDPYISKAETVFPFIFPANFSCSTRKDFLTMAYSYPLPSIDKFRT